MHLLFVISSAQEPPVVVVVLDGSELQGISMTGIIEEIWTAVLQTFSSSPVDTLGCSVLKKLNKNDLDTCSSKCRKAGTNMPAEVARKFNILFI